VQHLIIKVFHPSIHSLKDKRWMDSLNKTIQPTVNPAGTLC